MVLEGQSADLIFIVRRGTRAVPPSAICQLIIDQLLFFS
jgi:hypothetical protein